MSRKYHIVCEIEMADDSHDFDAQSWLAGALDLLFPEGTDKHPYRPKVLKAVEVAQPTPRVKK
jgi:hypothetical protein